MYDLHSAMDEGVKVRRRYSGEGRRSVLEAGSSQIRLAPSPGVQQGSNGIQGRAGGRSPRMYKEGREHRGRDSRAKSSKGPQILAAASAEQERTLVVMEATGHYWQNLFAALVAQGYAVALVNPLRTHRFAGEELARLRARLMQDVVDRVNQLHRLVDLGFPEFTRYLKNLNTQLATAILRQYPTAAAFRGLSYKRLARLSYDGRHRVGEELARQLIAAAAVSVGSQHTTAHQTGVRYACEDLET